MTPTNREIVDRFVQALVDNDLDAQQEMSHPDIVIEWPQSGERVRGAANARAIDENYPGGLPTAEPRRVIGGEDRWVVTPSMIPLRITGTGDVYTLEGRLTYPDDSVWYATVILELRDSKVARMTQYWSPTLPAPEWRKQWVERT